MLRLLAVRHIAHHLLDSQALRKRQRIELLRGDALKRPGLHIAGRIRFFGIVSRHIGSLASEFSTKNSVRSEEHTSELQSLMRISYAVFCLKKKNKKLYNNPKSISEIAQQIY